MPKSAIKFAVLSGLLVALFVIANPVSADNIGIDYTNLTSNTSGTAPQWFGWHSGTYGNIYEIYIPGSSHNICSATVRMSMSGVFQGDSVKLDLGIMDNPSIAGQAPTSTPSDLTHPLNASLVNYINAFELQQTADQQFQVSTSTYENYTFTFTPCAVVVGANFYLFKLYRTGNDGGGNNYYNLAASSLGNYATGTTGTLYSFGDSYSPGSPFQFAGGSTLFNTEGQFILNGTENYSAITPVNSSQTNCTPPSNILDVGGGITYSLCYLFIPSQATLNQYSNITNLLATKIPFSFLTEVETDINNAGSGTPTSFLEIPITAGGQTFYMVSSTTLSSLSSYFSPWRSLENGALYLAFASSLFYVAYNLFNKKQ